MSNTENTRENLKRKRQQKTSRRQYKLYLSELENNEIFRNNTISPANVNTLQDTWVKLNEKLNASGGSVRDVTGWKRVINIRYILYCPAFITNDVLGI